MKQVVQRSNFRVYLNKSQISLFDRTVGCARFVWNNRVNSFNNKEKTRDKTIKELKVEFPFLAEVPYNALEQCLQNWNQTKKQFFSKTRKTKLGRPKFKSKKQSEQSFTVSYNGFSLKKECLSISKFGKIKVTGLEKLLSLSNVSTLTLTRKASGKYFISVVHKAFKKQKEKTGKSIGIDLGLTHFLIDNQNNKVENPRFYRKSEAKLKTLQRALSKKEKNSSRYLKCKKKIAILHEKIANQRNYFLLEVANYYINSFDFIYTEDLSVKNMVKNRKLSKSISDASWSKFLCILEYKAEWYGKSIYKINRFFASSKTCSECGYQLAKLDLSIREWICPDCETVHDRDINAAQNILKRGIFEKSVEMSSCKTYLKKSDTEN
jgi:putative transposase